MKTRHSLFTVLFLSMAVILACRFLVNPTSTPPPTTLTTSITGQSVPTEESAIVENDPLDHLLVMRSIKINLTALRPDGTIRTIDVEIDSAGNMHAVYSLPALVSKDLPEGFDPSMLPASDEVYLVDGNAYKFSDQNPAWMTTPAETDYVKQLSSQMHGLDGFAIWLYALPEGSVNSAGKDSVGGFAVDKYTVSGTIDNQQVTGTLWAEPEAGALVQAELHVPAVLLSGLEDPQEGEIKITLNAQKADISPVTLPDAPAGQAGETATPNSQ